MARLETLVVWLCVIALFGAIYAGLPVGRVAVGLLIGAVLWWAPLELARRFVRSRSPNVNIGAAVLGGAASGLCGLPFGAPTMVAGAATPIAITGYIIAAGYRRRRRRQRMVAALERTCDASGDLAPLVAELATWRSAELTFALRVLVRHGRPDLVVELVSAPWWQIRGGMIGAVMCTYQVVALLDLGRVAEARAALDECPDPVSPVIAGELALTGVRLAVAEGKVTAVPPLVHEELADHRLEVLGDVLALAGDREGARRALSELRARDPERIARLGRTHRPAAAVATELIAEADGVYR